MKKIVIIFSAIAFFISCKSNSADTEIAGRFDSDCFKAEASVNLIKVADNEMVGRFDPDCF